MEKAKKKVKQKARKIKSNAGRNPIHKTIMKGFIGFRCSLAEKDKVEKDAVKAGQKDSTNYIRKRLGLQYEKPTKETK